MKRLCWSRWHNLTSRHHQTALDSPNEANVHRSAHVVRSVWGGAERERYDIVVVWKELLAQLKKRQVSIASTRNKSKQSKQSEQAKKSKRKEQEKRAGPLHEV
jgi:hypothetical protein